MNVSLQDNTLMKQDMQNFTALVIDFTPVLSAYNASDIPADASITFTSIGLTTTCIDEAPFRFPGQFTEEEMKPVYVVINKTEMVDVVQDSEEEPAYTTAATVWAIFFVLLLLLAAATFYLFFKNRKLLVLES